jgi:hypothetical protein
VKPEPTTMVSSPMASASVWCAALISSAAWPCTIVTVAGSTPTSGSRNRRDVSDTRTSDTAEAAGRDTGIDGGGVGDDRVDDDPVDAGGIGPDTRERTG